MLDINKIVTFAENGVEKFIKEHPSLTFYSFAFACNAEYGEINLCFNTEAAFSEILSYYQDRYPENYTSSENIQDLKYNTGDWKYQCFDTMFVLEEEELSAIFSEIYPDEVNDNYLAWDQFINELLDLFTESLIRFSKTKVFKNIKKTDNFNFFCIDHDEEVLEAFKRMERMEKYLAEGK